MPLKYTTAHKLQLHL